MKKWLVFYTKSRHEVRVKELLERKGFEVFLPVVGVWKQWSDRRKKIAVPLFRSYIFVRSTDDEISDILQVPGVAWNIRHNGKPAELREREFAMINQFVNSGYHFEVDKAISFEAGQKVRVEEGPLKGLEGNLLKSQSGGNTFILSIESIGASIHIAVDARILKRVQDE